jgi:hypothetical protein
MATLSGMIVCKSDDKALIDLQVSGSISDAGVSHLVGLPNIWRLTIGGAGARHARTRRPLHSKAVGLGARGAHEPGRGLFRGQMTII